MLLRNIAKDTKITVVDYVNAEEAAAEEKKAELESRWKAFLCVKEKNIQFKYDGASKFIKEEKEKDEKKAAAEEERFRTQIEI